jgi:predicted nucleic acid-binding protein
VCRDPDDDRVLECALAAGVEVIVSGDRDLQDLGGFRDTPIMSPRRFLDSGLWKR